MRGPNATPSVQPLKDYVFGKVNVGFQAWFFLPNARGSHDQSEVETEIRSGFHQGFRIGSSLARLSKVSFSDALKYEAAFYLQALLF